MIRQLNICAILKQLVIGKKVMQRFGEKLKQLREYHSITLSWLAQNLGYSSHSYLSEIECGRKLPTAQITLQISRLFNVSTDELLKDELDLTLTNSHIRHENSTLC